MLTDNNSIAEKFHFAALLTLSLYIDCKAAINTSQGGQAETDMHSYFFLHFVVLLQYLNCGSYEVWFSEQKKILLSLVKFKFGTYHSFYFYLEDGKS